jgi:hypothetical protein
MSGSAASMSLTPLRTISWSSSGKTLTPARPAPGPPSALTPARGYRRSLLPGTRPCLAGDVTFAAATQASTVQTITSRGSRGLPSRGSVGRAGMGASRLPVSRTRQRTAGRLGSECSLDASLNVIRQRGVLIAGENSGELCEVIVLVLVMSSHGLPHPRRRGRCA